MARGIVRPLALVALVACAWQASGPVLGGKSHLKLTEVHRLMVGHGVIFRPPEFGKYKWDASAASARLNSTGIAFVPAEGAIFACGLASGAGARKAVLASDQSYRSIDFAAYLAIDGHFGVLEFGSLRGWFGRWIPGDRVEVSLNELGEVEYRVNSRVRYSSGVKPVFPLHAKVASFTDGPVLNNLEQLEEHVWPGWGCLALAFAAAIWFGRRTSLGTGLEGCRQAPTPGSRARDLAVPSLAKLSEERRAVTWAAHPAVEGQQPTKIDSARSGSTRLTEESLEQHSIDGLPARKQERLERKMAARYQGQVVLADLARSYSTSSTIISDVSSNQPNSRELDRPVEPKQERLEKKMARKVAALEIKQHMAEWAEQAATGSRDPADETDQREIQWLERLVQHRAALVRQKKVAMASRQSAQLIKKQLDDMQLIAKQSESQNHQAMSKKPMLSAQQEIAEKAELSAQRSHRHLMEYRRQQEQLDHLVLEKAAALKLKHTAGQATNQAQQQELATVEKATWLEQPSPVAEGDLERALKDRPIAQNMDEMPRTFTCMPCTKRQPATHTHREMSAEAVLVARLKQKETVKAAKTQATVKAATPLSETSLELPGQAQRIKSGRLEVATRERGVAADNASRRREPAFSQSQEEKPCYGFASPSKQLVLEKAVESLQMEMAAKAEQLARLEMAAKQGQVKVVDLSRKVHTMSQQSGLGGA